MEVVRATRHTGCCPGLLRGQMAGGSLWNLLSNRRSQVSGSGGRCPSAREKVGRREVGSWPPPLFGTVARVEVAREVRVQLLARLLLQAPGHGGPNQGFHGRRKMTQSSRNGCTSYQGSGCLDNAERGNGAIHLGCPLPKVLPQCVRSQRPAKISCFQRGELAIQVSPRTVGFRGIRTRTRTRCC